MDDILADHFSADHDSLGGHLRKASPENNVEDLTNCAGNVFDQDWEKVRLKTS